MTLIEYFLHFLVSSDAFNVSTSPIASCSKSNGCRVPSCKKYNTFHSQIVKTVEPKESIAVQEWRRRCGCLRTSEKLKMILNCFPKPPPPSPTVDIDSTLTDLKVPSFKSNCISAYCMNEREPPLSVPAYQYIPFDDDIKKKKSSQETLCSRSRRLMSDVVALLQLSITATALGLYYIIYCYMQLIYFALKSAIFFHNADGPMKITIAVVSFTSLLVGFNLMIKMQRYIPYISIR